MAQRRAQHASTACRGHVTSCFSGPFTLCAFRLEPASSVADEPCSDTPTGARRQRRLRLALHAPQRQPGRRHAARVQPVRAGRGRLLHAELRRTIRLGRRLPPSPAAADGLVCDHQRLRAGAAQCTHPASQPAAAQPPASISSAAQPTAASTKSAAAHSAAAAQPAASQPAAAQPADPGDGGARPVRPWPQRLWLVWRQPLRLARPAAPPSALSLRALAAAQP